MKKYSAPLQNYYPLFVLFIMFMFGCSSDDSGDALTDDPIVGKWVLTTVNATDVSNVACYRDSFIDTNGKTITFFIQDRLANGDCETVLSNTQKLTIDEGFYFLEDEAVEIYIDGNTLTWRVDIETTLEFEK